MTAPQIKWISADDPPGSFPPVDDAAVVPDGLLAAGGDLSSERLLAAYRKGIFPWYDSSQPILWWSPNPRCVLRPGDFRVSRRLRRSVRNCEFELSFNSAFAAVMRECAKQRKGQRGTWITDEMKSAYSRLHAEGWAHSIEIWDGDALAGGVYGLAIGKVFFGESMFSRVTNASKVALMSLSRLLAGQGFVLIDCQVNSPHLQSLGASNMDRGEFTRLLQQACDPPQPAGFWPDRRISATEFLGGDPDALQ